MLLGVDLKDLRFHGLMKLVEDYFDLTRKKIEQMEFILIIQPIDKLWDLLSNYDIVFKYMLRITRLQSTKEQLKQGDTLVFLINVVIEYFWGKI